ncbi:hypothetical protein A28LD_1188 [Idiomarina sp. A28L]|nr:hypothetical protein A28LD_1188 [Idiomarina sp. A28L]
MEYTLVKTVTYAGLIKEVNDLIKRGWIPQGGIMEDQHGRCLQAMIKT